jgi:hypothetical protein
VKKWIILCKLACCSQFPLIILSQPKCNKILTLLAVATPRKHKVSQAYLLFSLSCMFNAAFTSLIHVIWPETFVTLTMSNI